MVYLLAIHQLRLRLLLRLNNNFLLEVTAAQVLHHQLQGHLFITQVAVVVVLATVPQVELEDLAVAGTGVHLITVALI